jgi:hypothetical protein
VSEREDFARGGRALIDLQLKLMRDATNAMAANAQRMQQDVDSILHAFAMMPVAANRAIRGAALAREEKLAATEPARTAPARKTRRTSPRPAGDHAR